MKKARKGPARGRGTVRAAALPRPVSVPVSCDKRFLAALYYMGLAHLPYEERYDLLPVLHRAQEKYEVLTGDDAYIPWQAGSSPLYKDFL